MNRKPKHADSNLKVNDIDNDVSNQPWHSQCIQLLLGTAASTSPSEKSDALSEDSDVNSGDSDDDHDDALPSTTTESTNTFASLPPCLLYTSDAADE